MWGYKKNTALNADFNLIFGNVYFVTVLSNTQGQKMRLSASSQNSNSQKSIYLSIWGHFFQRINFFQRKCAYFLLVCLTKTISTKRWALWLLAIKNYLLSCKSTNFGHFWLPRSTFKVDFLNVQPKFWKNSVNFLEKVKNIVLKIEFPIFSGLRAGRCFASRHFPKVREFS